MKTSKMCIQQHHYFSVVKFRTCNRENETEGWYNLCLSWLKRCDFMSNQSSLTSSRVPVVIGRGVRQINKWISNEWHVTSQILDIIIIFLNIHQSSTAVAVLVTFLLRLWAEVGVAGLWHGWLEMKGAASRGLPPDQTLDRPGLHSPATRHCALQRDNPAR